MKKEELLKFCRYYHGENEAPKKDAEGRFFWNTERLWVVRMQDDKYTFSDELEQYIGAQLTHFSEKDDTPITLKALMYQYFLSVNNHVDTEDFKFLYQKY